jgi:hypothetical protein
MAQISDTIIGTSYRDRGFNVRVMLIVAQSEVIEAKIK